MNKQSNLGEVIGIIAEEKIISNKTLNLAKTIQSEPMLYITIKNLKDNKQIKKLLLSEKASEVNEIAEEIVTKELKNNKKSYLYIPGIRIIEALRNQVLINLSGKDQEVQTIECKESATKSKKESDNRKQDKSMPDQDECREDNKHENLKHPSKEDMEDINQLIVEDSLESKGKEGLKSKEESKLKDEPIYSLKKPQEKSLVTC